MSDRECVKVVVRCRPLSRKELDEKHPSIVDVDENAGSITIRRPDATEASSPMDAVKTFTFDHAFGHDCKQIDVYNKTARPIVDAVLAGYNGTIFAYGQTGSGKSFSMTGVRDDKELRGIIPNSFEHIFQHIARASTNERYLVRTSYLEIYNEEIRDLLVAQTKRLELKEHPDTGVYVKDLSTFVVKDFSEIERLLDVGAKNRSVGATLMNAESSRSHSIFTITIEASEKGADGEERLRMGKLHLVDLAGSERQSKTGATGDRLKEAAKINLSLTALGNVIASLVDGKSQHIPYRDSKLTRMLQDSLGGNSKTMMIATASPASYNYDETMGTLRYANRTKQIKNKPKVNEDPKDTMLREYQEEIARLKAQLEGLESGEGDVLNGADDASNEDEEDDDDSNSEEANSSPSKKRQARKQGTSTAATQRTRRNSETRQLSEQKIRELQESIDRERQALLQSQDATEAEKQKTLQALQQREAELEWERQARETLAQKLAAMQAKLLVGDGTETILDQAEKHARELQRQAAELEERRRAEEELQHGLDEQEELHFQIEESYTSLQEEAAEKTRKLKQLWTMLMRHKSEINDMEEQFYREKEQLLDAVNDLSNELKMKTLIVDTYIPADYQQVIESKAMYDAEMDKWTIEHAAESAARHQEQLQQRRSERRASKDAAHNPFVAATNAMASGSSPRKASRTSMSRASPTKTTTARRLSSAVAESETASIDAAPMPRGLVVNAKRYA